MEVSALTKRFGGSIAVDGIYLDIQPGEFFCLIGASGCGKTTSLRMIAGLEAPSSGSITLDGKEVTYLPPNKRNINTVFQSYALFPHLSVEDNVAFGLQFKNLSKAATGQAVSDALALVRMDGYEHRTPSQLSGGQQQRVALARALVLQPALLLLDEPLGALDAQLREALQVELKSLQESLGTSFLYVTHDQHEALRMADRIAVMSGGRIVQVGPPEEVYRKPRDTFVAEFLGAANLLPCTVEETIGDVATIRIAGTDQPLQALGGAITRGRAVAVIRPEHVHVTDVGTSLTNCFEGVIDRTFYAGASTELYVRISPEHSVRTILSNPHLRAAVGDRVMVHFVPTELRVLER